MSRREERRRSQRGQSARRRSRPPAPKKMALWKKLLLASFLLSFCAGSYVVYKVYVVGSKIVNSIKEASAPLVSAKWWRTLSKEEIKRRAIIDAKRVIKADLMTLEGQPDLLAKFDEKERFATYITVFQNRDRWLKKLAIRANERGLEDSFAMGLINSEKAAVFLSSSVAGAQSSTTYEVLAWAMETNNKDFQKKADKVINKALAERDKEERVRKRVDALDK
jgi:hypothetical protein